MAYIATSTPLMTRRTTVALDANMKTLTVANQSEVVQRLTLSPDVRCQGERTLTDSDDFFSEAI